MPQRGAPPKLPVPKPSLPASFEPDAPAPSAGQRGALPASFEPEETDYHDNAPPPLTWQDFIPTPRTALRTGGAMVGGIVGGAGGTVGGVGVGAVPGAMIGGGAGASIGESLYRMGARSGLFNDEGLATTPGGVLKEHAGAATIGALQEGLPAAITNYGPNLLRSSAVKKIVQVTRPTTEGESAAVKKAATSALEKFPIAGSAEGLQKRYASNLTNAVQALEAEYAAVPASTRINTNPIVNQLRTAKAEYLMRGQGVPGTSTVTKTYDSLIDWFAQHPYVKLDELRQNRQIWDNLINYWKGSLSKMGEKEIAYKKAADVTREVINTTFPKIAERNREVSTWTTLNDVLNKANTKGFGGVHPILPFSVAGATANLLGGTPTNWAEGVLGGAVANTILNSTAYKTASVTVQRNIASALEHGNVELAVKMLARLGSAEGQQYAKAASRMIPPPPEPAQQ